jgi:hypothetical protein
MATVTAGEALCGLAYVAQQTFESYGWLGPKEKLHGLGMGTTPGPLIMILWFVGVLMRRSRPLCRQSPPRRSA